MIHTIFVYCQDVLIFPTIHIVKQPQLLYNARETVVIVSTCGEKKMADKRNYERRIVIDPKVHFGKPCIAGTRIPVEDVLELIQENIPFTEIMEKYYPDLEIEDIKACARYATDLVRSEEIHAELA
jgi:uncharacterized protein (DUF433 family)